MMNAVETPRYLVSFHPKRLTHRFTDVLILGSGLAGLRAALAVDPARHVLILTKEAARQSNSQYAQGGIAAVWDPTDCFASHIRDTLDAGKGICDLHVVEQVVGEAPARVRELMSWGAVFDQVNGEVALGREGGHSFSRILHALGDATGREVIRAVLNTVATRANIQVIENTFTIDLITMDDRCVGAVTWREGQIQLVWAKSVVLATGGCGQLYRESTNPPVATGDGLALAYRAGATLQDMEFIQFHPTVLYVAGSARSLISEAVRGEGAHLRDALGCRFMPDYHPAAELAPRDTVAQAIVSQMAKSQHPCVYLDQSHLDPALVRARFPGITATCRKYGLDFARDPIPVRPGAHYMIGGIRTDNLGRTSLLGLWACGEVAATGLHGANRLASNSLLEAMVYGHISGVDASDFAARDDANYRPLDICHRCPENEREELDLGDIRNALTSLMFRDVGIQRTAAGLENARKNVDFWCQYVLPSVFDQPDGWELQNMLTVAGLMIRFALERTESRGTHFRGDYPRTNDQEWCCHLLGHPRPFRLERLPLTPCTGSNAETLFTGVAEFP